MKKSVRFNAVLSSADVREMPTLSQDDCANLWHQDTDLEKFRCLVRDLIDGRASKEEDASGLDQFSQKRRSRKNFTRECVLLAQQRHLGPDYVREVSEDLSADAKIEALREGRNAYYCAYPEQEQVSLKHISRKRKSLLFPFSTFNNGEKQQRADATESLLSALSFCIETSENLLQQEVEMSTHHHQRSVRQRLV
jgi:hypothetical protein